MPRRPDLRQTAALGAAVLIAIQLAATHWFYLYVVWFVPFVLVALFAAHARTLRERAAEDSASASRCSHEPLALEPRRARALALLVAGWALTLWVAPWSDERVNDLFVYRSFAEPLLDGALPYRDFAFEYPPLAAPAIALPGLLGTGEESFRWAFAIWTLAGGAAVVLLCGALARATGGEPRRAMFAAALMPLLCGALVRTHFDLFPVALLLGGLLLLAATGRAPGSPARPGGDDEAVPARGRAGGARLAGRARPAARGVAGRAARARRRSRSWRWPPLAVSPDGAADAVRYHLDRPVQIESSPAMVCSGWTRSAWATR